MTTRDAMVSASNAGSWRASSQLAWFELALAIVLATGWLFLTAPSPLYFVFSNETGHQLAGGWNLLHSGQWPQLDYVTSYGPGRYFISAFGLWMANDGLLGELLTRSVCDVLYLVLLQRLLRRVGMVAWLSWLLFVLAAVALPPSHKYWTALCPILTFWAARLCVERWAGWRWLLLGMAVGLAGVFRADYGLFSIAPAVVLLLTMPDRGTRGRALVHLLLGAAVLLGPWLILVQQHESLWRFFVEWAQTGAATGAGLSMAHPLWEWKDPFLSVAFLFCVTVPAGGLWLTRRLRGIERGFAWAVYVFALVNLVQSSHRADWSHLLQGIAPGLVGFALFLRDCPGFESAIVRVARSTALLVMAVCLCVGGVTTPVSPGEAIANWRAATLSKQEFERRYVAGTPMGQLASVATACVPRGTPTAVYPFTPQLHYFAERPFAAALPYLAPGFFAAAEQQDRAATVLEAQRPPVLFWNEAFAYDDVPLRNAVVTHARVHAYVEAHYTRKTEMAGFGVFVRNGVRLAAGCPLAN